MNQNNISLEKVIKGMEVCSPAGCAKEKCPYYEGPESEFWGNPDGYECEFNLRQDAIKLLKAQESRVMTWEEAKASVNDGPFIIFEVRDSTGSELDFGVLVDDSYEMSEGSLLTVEFFPKMEDEYGKHFRMWTSRPTDEQREAVKWK